MEELDLVLEESGEDTASTFSNSAPDLGGNCGCASNCGGCTCVDSTCCPR
ncbi:MULTISPECIES: hypothetical protein [unclassified Oceanobacillus]